MWNSTKICVTPGMHLTLQPPVSFLGGDALQEAVE
jgi:hypothetical protein